MILSQQDLQAAELSFEPPLTRPAANRRVFLIAKRGAILEGIKTSKKKGITIPSVLRIRNRPELLESDDPIEQPIDDMTREILRMRIREKLDKGSPVWPEGYGRRA